MTAVQGRGRAAGDGRADFIPAEGSYVTRVQIDGGKAGEQRLTVKSGDNATQEVVVGR